jgi:hypothetical protein
LVATVVDAAFLSRSGDIAGVHNGTSKGTDECVLHLDFQILRMYIFAHRIGL